MDKEREAEADKDRIRRTYDRLAPWYDLLEAVPDRLLGMVSWRRRLLARARGRVLEVAVGTGRNLEHYPDGCRIVGLDGSRGMLERARGRGASGGRNPGLVRGDTERLPFPAATFDTVVDSLALCTYPRPVRALEEMARVCRTDGRVLLLEHGRSSWEPLGWLQDRRHGMLSRRAGCRWNRRPREIVERSGLELASARRGRLGIFHALEVRPPAEPGRPA